VASHVAATGSDSSKITGRSAPASRSSTAIKRTTTNSNNIVTIARTSAAPAPKAKFKLKHEDLVKDEPIELQDEDDSHEEEAALASPVKGSESRKMSKVCIFYRVCNTNTHWQ
jgi:hypothetical protein